MAPDKVPDAPPVPPAAKGSIDIGQFHAVDMRVGTVVSAVVNAKARRPAYALEVDLGFLGRRRSSAQLVGDYAPADLVGRQVICVVNLPPRNVAGVESQVLVLANLSARGTRLLGVEDGVENGAPVA